MCLPRSEIQATQITWKPSVLLWLILKTSPPQTMPKQFLYRLALDHGDFCKQSTSRYIPENLGEDSAQRREAMRRRGRKGGIYGGFPPKKNEFVRSEVEVQRRRELWRTYGFGNGSSVSALCAGLHQLMSQKNMGPTSEPDIQPFNMVHVLEWPTERRQHCVDKRMNILYEETQMRIFVARCSH
ncbi:hypothetical protein M413DRAFT_434688 [Hebeloma cylindrosporum]|uniref:Uncharacterized protein n=1 Tax=Hebeloma cylindrosporum TaxID=76867 RepID=A0A0C2YRV4_HEBCY|nr:hypothetical protein M413DRAFT_434688 [Hebeloma cylindrosporum h7]